MKIGRSKISTTRTSASAKKGAASPGAKAGEGHGVRDSVSIAGIPEAELTPKVRAALGSLIEEVNTLRGQLGALKEQLSQAQQQADHDPLLEIPNRRAFVRDLSREIAMAERYKAEAALIFIDLNDLKKINDTHGHAAGDAALKHIASLLQGNIRAVDSFGRIGGDEFGLILKNAKQDIAHRKIANLEEIIAATPLIWNDQSITLSMACGVIDLHGNLTVEETLDKADQAMYVQKNRSR